MGTLLQPSRPTSHLSCLLSQSSEDQANFAAIHRRSISKQTGRRLADGGPRSITATGNVILAVKSNVCYGRAETKPGSPYLAGQLWVPPPSLRNRVSFRAFESYLARFNRTTLVDHSTIKAPRAPASWTFETFGIRRPATNVGGKEGIGQRFFAPPANLSLALSRSRVPLAVTRTILPSL
ncbi:hypothetical protein PGT21_032946 [Puccinia graminis f. sp. tritici]|uniref:Uncharacterized protein n=1 Tax=Puccinia graminis f. sp. tritici TaxID=56615 RepID=A0A5B0Q786_PUCGR|nr:hypothetical protein PGT21_032946 [Puccinia graminis f. sp. tritici]